MDTRMKLIVLGSIAALLGPKASSAQDAGQILAQVDSVLTAPQDIVATQRIVLVDSDGRERERSLRVYQQGDDRRMAKFTAPADVRDVGFLRLDDDRMYLYLPAFRRVRRIASSIKHEAFMGTDLSYEDLSRTRFAGDYRAVATTATANGYSLALEARDDADVSYGRILMEVDPETWVILRMELFGRNGRLVKTVTASDLRQVGPYWMAHRIEVEAADDGHRTILEYDDLQVDTGLDDGFFTERQLKRSG